MKTGVRPVLELLGQHLTSMEWGIMRIRLLLAGLVPCAMLSVVSMTTSAPVAAAATAHTVSIDCAGQGVPDERTTYDASVQPGIVVPDTSGWPYSPVTYQAYMINRTSPEFPELISRGNVNEYNTTDHLVSIWANSTDCQGSASDGSGDISRNAWVADSSGHVFGEDDFTGPPAQNYGDASGLRLNQPIVGMTPTADGQGYWLVAADGGIFAYGDTQFYGSAGSLRLNQPIVGMSVTPDGGGYTLVATDGGVFNYGDSQFYGSLGSLKLNKPIEGLVNTPDGGGYWMVASDGGIFAFGDAPFLGSLGSENVASPIVGMFAYGNGYTLVAQDGTLYPFG